MRFFSVSKPRPEDLQIERFFIVQLRWVLSIFHASIIMQKCSLKLHQVSIKSE